MKAVVVLSLLFGLLVPSNAITLSLEQDLKDNLKERPVMKVVRLLQDTKAELEKELEDDKAVYELMTCWCKEGNQAKEAAIAGAKAKISELESSMGADAAKIAELKQKRKETLDEVNSDHKALMDASAMRMKENKEFQASETDYLEAIDAAKNAIIVLGKHNAANFGQLKAAAHRLLDARTSHLVERSRHADKARTEVLRTFLRNAEQASSFLAIPGMQSYAPQSGQIFGILEQMKEDFEVNLSEAQKTEAKAKAEYESLKAAKEDEIKTGRELIVTTDGTIAELQEKYAEESKQLEDTQKQLGLDTEFLANLTEKCATMDADYDKRVKDRMTEIEAVTDTIGILNSDESFEAFDKMDSPNPPTFLQTDAPELRQRAVAVLQHAARNSGAPEVALLAVRAQLDAFTKVKTLIDKMVKELAAQQQEEVEHRDFCISELNSNKRSTDLAYDKKESLQSKMADLTSTIEKLTKDLDTAKKAIADAMDQMKRASETREAENADFQTTVSDHRVMSMILTKALERMRQVYAMLQQRQTGPGAPHVQTSATHTDPGNGPAKFKKYDQNNAGGGRVVKMLEEILADTKKVEDQAIASEQDAQSAYENFMKDSNKMITATSEAISDMTSARARAKEELAMAKADFKQTMAELEGLDTTKNDLHKACDYILENFDTRQSARAAEMDALKEAKAILSGMN